VVGGFLYLGQRASPTDVAAHESADTLAAVADGNQDAVAVEVAELVGAETAVGETCVDQLVVAESPGAERVDEPIGPGRSVPDLCPAGVGLEGPDLDAPLCQIRGPARA
jgi:hypothetical protein